MLGGMPGLRADAVIFDLDGTLVDSLADIAAAMNHALAALGFPGHEADAYRRFIGDGVTTLARRALPVDRGELLDAVVAGFRARYAEALLVATRPYPGIPELLDALTALGVPMSILSNKPHDATVMMVERLLARWRFAGTLGQRPGVPIKPDPVAALELAATMRVEPGRCVLVGDGDADMRAARAAGMVAVGALWGFRDREVLVEAGAMHTIARPAELLAWLGG